MKARELLPDGTYRRRDALGRSAGDAQPGAISGNRRPNRPASFAGFTAAGPGYSPAAGESTRQPQTAGEDVDSRPALLALSPWIAGLPRRNGLEISLHAATNSPTMVRHKQIHQPRKNVSVWKGESGCWNIRRQVFLADWL